MAPSSTVPPVERILSSVKWLAPEEFLAGGGGPLPALLWRTLLLTDGSTTLFLQALCRKPILLEMIDQRTAPLPAPLTGWLTITPSQPVLQRRVWLTDGDRRLALGYALISMERLSPTLQERLDAGTLPIGLLAGELGLPSIRDRLQVGRLADPALARQFGQFESTAETLWCRRYGLAIPNELTAVILEIFSPALASMSST
jgi:chorismate-pyruvate lyase